MSSLRLVHSKNHPTRGEPDESADGSPRASSSAARLQSMVEKLYRLDRCDSNSLEVFDQLVDDLLAEARRDEKPAGGGQ
jgi:hypothetical protein